MDSSFWCYASWVPCDLSIKQSRDPVGVGQFFHGRRSKILVLILEGSHVATFLWFIAIQVKLVSLEHCGAARSRTGCTYCHRACHPHGLLCAHSGDCVHQRRSKLHEQCAL